MEQKKSDSKLILKDLKIEIRHIKVREHYGIALEQQLSKGMNIHYDFKSAEVTSYSLPASTTNFVAPAVLLSYKPTFILAAFVKSSNFLGDVYKDGHEYAMNDLNQFAFVINGGLSPKTPLTFKKTTSEKKYADAFINLFRALDIQSDNCSSLVNFENFTTNCFFLAQDLTALNFGLSNIQEPLTNANIGFSCVFSTPTKEPYTVLFYALKNRKFVINALRKVEAIY